MKNVHRLLDWLGDRFAVETWQVEKMAKLALELGLLLLCAWPAMTTAYDSIVQSALILGRLYQVEIGREKSSLIGRAEEQGTIPARPKLAPKKEAILERIKWHEPLVQWVLPVFVPIAATMAARGQVGWAVVAGVVATVARSGFDWVLMPNWRLSRLAWQDARRRAAEELRPLCAGHGRVNTTRPLFRCCDRAGEYNGFGSDGPILFDCARDCSCHD